jgi:hypothetical protein
MKFNMTYMKYMKHMKYMKYMKFNNSIGLEMSIIQFFRVLSVGV